LYFFQGWALEPFEDSHKEGLRAACAADPQLWEELYIYSMVGEAFDAQWDRLRKEQARGETIPFAVVVDGTVRGVTTYLRIDRHHRTLEIGGTYYEPSVRGGAVNPACKRLLMAYAFEAGANRVQYCVDAKNARSRAAVLKLGAVQEGILRRDKITWTGRLRDTVYFSVLPEEWPAVRERLDQRLAAFA
jgi:N-acetyltransferase